MKMSKLNDTEAKTMAQGYPYVLVRELSRLYLGEAAQADIRWDELTEARFFNDTSELRIWEEGGQFSAVLLEDEGEDTTTCMEKSYNLAHKGVFGKKLTVVEYFGYDEDGQLYRAATRLKGWVK